MSKTMPVQERLSITQRRNPACVPAEVALRAYEVYCHLYGEQEALVTGNCRGGFGVGELVAFLYARSFPQDEWRQRVDDVLHEIAL
ncbi:hypothetical protein LCGC14_2011120 [marine sediment metagenome]|uniref:Uncharacterized protein n=1 Tax=marine sediment metagenome TaxID=412755 RepID=A0A0F9F0I1_9ZZZZ